MFHKASSCLARSKLGIRVLNLQLPLAATPLRSRISSTILKQCRTKFSTPYVHAPQLKRAYSTASSTFESAANATRAIPKAKPDVVPPKSVGYWLIGTSTLIFGIVVLGGLTRLTESGLSITEWKPVTGSIPL